MAPANNQQPNPSEPLQPNSKYVSILRFSLPLGANPHGYRVLIRGTIISRFPWDVHSSLWTSISRVYITKQEDQIIQDDSLSQRWQKAFHDY